MQRLVRSLVNGAGGLSSLIAPPMLTTRGVSSWSACGFGAGARGPNATDLTWKGFGHGGGFVATSRLGGVTTASNAVHTQHRHATKGVGVHVGGDGDVDRAMRKLKRTMINEGIEKDMKGRRVFVKGSDQRVIAKRERDHRKWKKTLRSKLGWIMRRKDRGF